MFSHKDGNRRYCYIKTAIDYYYTKTIDFSKYLLHNQGFSMIIE